MDSNSATRKQIKCSWCYLRGRQIRCRKIGLYTGELWVFYWFGREGRKQWWWMQERARRPPDRLNVLTGNLVDTTSVAIVETEEPTAIKEALSFVNCMLWWEPIQSEYDSLKQCQTWDLVDLPSSKNMVGRKWVFKHKWDADGQIQQCKAFLVAHGYSRKFVLTTMKFFHVCQSLTQSVLC